MTNTLKMIPFGKYKGKNIEDFFFDLAPVSKKSSYIKWLLDNDVMKGAFKESFMIALKKNGLTLSKYREQIENLVQAYKEFCWRKAREERESRPRYSKREFSGDYDDSFYGHATDYPEYY